MKTIEIEIQPITASNGSIHFHAWKEEDGWYSCRSGEYRGNGWESDDIGPFLSEAEALEAQKEELKIYEENK